MFTLLFLYLFLPLRRARVTFDTSETQKVFGPIVIDYHQVCTISLHLLFGLETENSFRSRTGCIYDTNPCEAMPYIFEVGCVPWGNKYLFSGFKVQSKVNMKYDTWHKEILSKFASRLGDNMQDFYGSVSKVILHFLFSSCHSIPGLILFLWLFQWLFAFQLCLSLS